MAYDIGKIIVGTISNNRNLVHEGKIDLAVDTTAAAIPFAPAGLTKAARVAEKVAEKTPIWSSTKNKTAVENAFGHWKKHKSEFPELNNAKEYVERSKEFLNNPPPSALTKINAKGDTLRYDPKTNTFGVLSKDGYPRTMFRPTDKLDYWNRQ
jgi:filamentous hemagglutinin